MHYNQLLIAFSTDIDNFPAASLSKYTFEYKRSFNERNYHVILITNSKFIQSNEIKGQIEKLIRFFRNDNWVFVYPYEIHELVISYFVELLSGKEIIAVEDNKITSEWSVAIKEDILSFTSIKITNLYSILLFRLGVGMDVEQTLKELENSHFSEILGTDDITFRVLMELIDNGGEEELNVIAKRNNIIPDILWAYFKSGSYFRILNLPETDWWIDGHWEKDKRILYVKEKFIPDILNALKDRVVPERIQYIVDQTTGQTDTIKSMEIIKIAKECGEENRKKIETIIKGAILNIGRDKIGRSYLTIREYEESPNYYLVTGSFWEFIMLVCAGENIGERQVVNINKITCARRKQDLIIDDNNYYSLLVSGGYTKKAVDTAGYYDNPKIVLLRIVDFLKIIGFISRLNEQEKQFAAWSLFQIGESGQLESTKILELYRNSVENLKRLFKNRE